MNAPRAATEGPLRGVRVLLTRARDDNEPLRALLVDAGAVVRELPTLATAVPDDLSPLDVALRRLAGYDWIVFSSRHAVTAVCGRLAALALPAVWPRVAAVGPATAAVLRQRDVRVDCLPSQATGSALAAAIVGCGLGGGRVLLPAGDLARPELRAGLEAAGAQVEQVTVYRTVRPDVVGAGDAPWDALAALERGEIDVVVLLSPSAITNLVEMLGARQAVLQRARLACIGPTTAAAVRERGFLPAIVAEDHTVPGLVRALTHLMAEHAHDPI